MDSKDCLNVHFHRRVPNNRNSIWKNRKISDDEANRT